MQTHLKKKFTQGPTSIAKCLSSSLDFVLLKNYLQVLNGIPLQVIHNVHPLCVAHGIHFNVYNTIILYYYDIIVFEDPL